MAKKKEKKVQKYMTLYMSFGMCFGVSFGIIYGNLLSQDNQTLGISLGMMFGMCIGMAIGAEKDKKLSERMMRVVRMEVLPGSAEMLIYAEDQNGEEKEYRISEKKGRDKDFMSEPELPKKRMAHWCHWKVTDFQMEFEDRAKEEKERILQ